MALNANWAKMSSTTGGTANLTLTIIAGYPTFTHALGNSNVAVYYVINGAGKREAGIGTYYPTNTSIGILSRDTVVQSWDGGSSFGTAAVNFDVVGVDVFCGPIAQHLVHTETDQTISGLKTFSGNTVTFTGDINASGVTITANVFSGNAVSLTSLNATALATGTVPIARLDANVILTTSTTGINASALSVGTVPAARLGAANSTSNGAITNTTQTFAGNKTFDSDVTVTGNLVLLGQGVTLNTNSVVIQDSLIQLASNNTLADALDIGLFGNYNGDGGAHEHTGLFRDASDGVWKLFIGLQETPTGTTVNTTGTGYAIGTLQSYLTSTIFQTNATALTITSNGSYAATLTVNAVTATTLNVSGAVALSNTLSVTGAVNALGALGVGGVFTALSTSTLTGAATLSNTVSVTGAANALSTLGVGGVFTALSTSTLTGAVTMSNTASITGAANALSTLGVGGVFTALSTSTLTGAVTMSNTASITGAVNALSTLGVGGVFTALSTSTLTGAVTMSNTASITGAVNALSTLGVGGAFSALSTSAHTGAATFSNTITVTGTATMNGIVDANNKLTLNTTNGRFVLPVGVDKWAT